MLRFKLVHIDEAGHRHCLELSARNSFMAMGYMEQLYGDAIYMSALCLPRGPQ